jgi:predicted extracellular nuclease
MESQRVVDLAVVVTLVDRNRRSPGFWVQDLVGDGDEATSDGLRVDSSDLDGLRPGQRISLSGRIVERGRDGQLSVTMLSEATWHDLGGAGELPPPVRLGRGGRRIPDLVVDDDGLSRFDAADDAIDFWESLEGMRVQLDDPVVVGATTRFGEVAVAADDGHGGSPRTWRGGLLATPEDSQPEAIMIAPGRFHMPRIRVGDGFDGALSGVVHYDFGTYRVVLDEEPPPVRRADLRRDRSALRGDDGHVTVATYNVSNLGGDAGRDRFERLARSLVEDLGAPDLVALQEVQDVSGERDDGAVAGAPVVERLVEEVARAGGPSYHFVQIDPENNRDGGAPGSNIRNVLLYRASRLQMPERGRPTAGSVRVDKAGRLQPNPGRIVPGDGAFRASRKPLVVELAVAGEPLYVVVLHLASKRGDDGLFGSVQPPLLHSERTRNRQADRVAELVTGLRANDPAARIVVLGDLNEHEFRPPMERLEAAGLVNLAMRVPLAERYTYNYRGRSQVLDHILVTPELARGAEVDIVHVNADFAADRRISDHDAVVARLRLE